MSSDDPKLDDIRVLAERYRRDVQGSNRGHYAAAKRAELRGRFLGISSSVVSAIVGTSIFATLQSSLSMEWRVAAGILATAAAVLSALQTFLDNAKRAAEYRTSGAAYGSLRREFDRFFLELATAKDRSNLIMRISELQQRIDELGQESPLIPPWAYKAGLKQLSKSWGNTTEDPEHD